MRGDGALGCCHSCESYKDGIDCKSRVGVSRNDDTHCRLEFFIGGGDSGFTVGVELGGSAHQSCMRL